MSDSVARALALIAIKKANDILAKLDGISFKQLSKSEYDSIIEKDNNVIYVVNDNGNKSLYIGNSKIGDFINNPTNDILIPNMLISNIIGDFSEVNER